MITNIDLSTLRNAEYLGFMTEALEIVRSFPENALQCDVRVGTLRILVAESGILYRSDPASFDGGELAGLDAARDRLITGLVKYCDAHTYGPDPDKRAAADLLCRSIGAYGADIARQSYAAESAAITNILTEWNTRPELVAAAALLDAAEWLAALQDVNDRFKTSYQRRYNAADGVVPRDTLLEKRGETDAAWYELCECLNNAFATHDGAVPWGTAVARLNALIAQHQRAPGSRLIRASATWPEHFV